MTEQSPPPWPANEPEEPWYPMAEPDDVPRQGHRRRQDSPRRKFSPWALTGILAVIVLVVALLAVSCLGTDDPNRTTADVPTVPVTTAPTSPGHPPVTAAPPVELPEGAIAGDLPQGEAPYVIGSGEGEVAAGKYLTAGPLDGSATGVWERWRKRSRSSVSGEPEEPVMIASGVVDSAEIIVVRAGDSLVVRGLKPLHKVA